MTQFTAPGFQVGDRAFLADGRSGMITASRFDEEAGVWLHLLDGIFEFFSEDVLFHVQQGEAPPLPEPEPVDEPPAGIIPAPVGEFVTHDEMREFVVQLIRLQPEAQVSRADLDAAVNAGVERSNLIAQGNLQTHIADVESKAADIELFTAAQFSQLESTVTTTLSEISNRAQALETAAEETSGTGFLGFIGGLGGLVSNPVEWIMSRLGDHIVSEVNDGLNR